MLTAEQQRQRELLLQEIERVTEAADRCGGGGAVIAVPPHRDKPEVLGPVEDYGWLATQAGYVTVAVNGRNIGQVCHAVTWDVFGAEIQKLYIADAMTDAINLTAQVLRAWAKAVGLSTDYVVNAIGDEVTFGEWAAGPCETAGRSLAHERGQRVTARQIAERALNTVPEGTFLGLDKETREGIHHRVMSDGRAE